MSASPSSGRMSWTEAVAGPRASATGLWQDLDSLRVSPAPEAPPSTSILWGWRPDSWLVPATYEQVVVDGIGDGVGPITFLRPA